MTAKEFEHYRIRLVCMEDLDGYFALVDNNRKRLEDFFAGLVSITRTMEDTRKHLQDVIDKNARKDFYSFVVEDLNTGAIIASIQVKSMDWNIPKGELGYFIDENYEGKGIISRATRIIVDYCFTELELNKLFIRAGEKNTASVKIAEKNGFTLEGILRKDYKNIRGELVDLMYFGRLKDE